ncbi:putative immunity protein [Nocardia brasiliensis]|uniref:putative immunity protein n=1 Tax=Nocardia brasiliensis TaxID=37326 RepID=UPI001895F5A9|nr:exonuclease SbcC [Nocardia brasiliensis]MBF6129383.1 exonuclease SbcC [Nocardia brasiliensis]
MGAAEENLTIPLTMAELREVTAYALACAAPVVPIFERACPGDARVRAVLEHAREFAAGGKRTKAIRVTSLAAHRAAWAAEARDEPLVAAAAHAAGATGSSAYLHPLAKATQVWHILGAAAYTAWALELDAGGDREAAGAHLARAREWAGPTVLSVLARYPAAPNGRGRAGELVRTLDRALRRG